MVLKEYCCMAHGPFEAFESDGQMPQCPAGCSVKFVTREFRTAPSIGSGNTRMLDGMQNGLASDFGLSDIKAGHDDGKSVMQNLRKASTPEEFAPRWVSMPNPPAPGWSRRGEKAPTIAPKSLGLEGGNSMGNSLPRNIPTNVVARVSKDELQ